MANEIANCALLPLIELEGMNPNKAFPGEIYVDQNYDTAYYKDIDGIAHRLSGSVDIPDSGFFDFYISPNGNDVTGDGSLDNPRRSISGILAILNDVRYPIFDVQYNINMANGTYDGNLIYSSSRIIRLIGNVSNPNLVILSSANSTYNNVDYNTSLVIYNSRVHIEGVRFENPGTFGSQIIVTFGSDLEFKNVVFTQSSGNHILIGDSNVLVLGGYKISGGALYHMRIEIGGGDVTHWNPSVDESNLYNSTSTVEGVIATPSFIEFTEQNITFISFIANSGGRYQISAVWRYFIVGLSDDNSEKTSVILLSNSKTSTSAQGASSVSLPRANDGVLYFNYPNLTIPQLESNIYVDGQIALISGVYAVRHNGKAKVLGDANTYFPGPSNLVVPHYVDAWSYVTA